MNNVLFLSLGVFLVDYENIESIHGGARVVIFKNSYKKHFQELLRLDIIIFFIIVPLMVTSIYFLPQTIKQYFVFNSKNPIIYSFILSSYTHITFWHYFSNMVNYFLVMFIIINIENNKKRLYFSFIVTFVLLPFLISLSHLYFLENITYSYGFSGIVSFYIGYIIYLTYEFIKNRFIPALNVWFVWLIVGINFLLTYFIWRNISLLMMATVLLVISLIFIKPSFPQVINTLGKITKRTIVSFDKSSKETYKAIYIVITVIYLFSLPMLLYFDPTRKPNILAHYVGWITGIIIPMIYIECLTIINYIKKGGPM